MTDGETNMEVAREPYRERLILFILAAVQFTTIVDFMIVMPLGPQLMRTLEIGPAQFGLIVSSYTFAAGVAGLIASAIADRYARRSTFLVLYAGFLIGTILCALAPTYHALVLARILTGAFGGILGGMTMAIIGDVFPEHRRGRATGSLMSGFAVASVVGVPLGLVIGTNFGWHMTFVALAVGGLPVLALTPYALPPLDAHVGGKHLHPLQSLIATFTHTNHLKAFALMITLMISSFTVFPLLGAYLVANVGLSEQQLPLVYIAGGCLTLLAAPIVGRWADRYGKLTMYRFIAPASALLLFTITHLPSGNVLLAIGVFGCLMVCNVGRMIPAMAMITSSAETDRRGAFLSANSSIQHIASGCGAYVGGLIVTQSSSGRLENFGTVGWIAASATLFSLWLAGRVRTAEQLLPPPGPIRLPPLAESHLEVAEPILSCAEAGTE